MRVSEASQLTGRKAFYERLLLISLALRLRHGPDAARVQVPHTFDQTTIWVVAENFGDS
jgi:hypothetical protein